MTKELGNQPEGAPDIHNWNDVSKSKSRNNVVFDFSPMCKINIHESILM